MYHHDQWRDARWKPPPPRDGSGGTHRDAQTAHRTAQDSKGRPDPDSGPKLSGRSRWGKEQAQVPPESPSLGLEVPSHAQERPSCGSPESAPLVLAGGRGKEAASLGRTTRPSAGRPRKVSLRSLEKTSRRFVWRPRMVSQGTTDTIPKNLTAQVHRWKRKGKTQDNEKIHNRHRREVWEDEAMGAALQNHYMESVVLLGGPTRRSQSLHPERQEDG